MITSFSQLLEFAKNRPSKRICVANAHDLDVLKSVQIAQTEKIATFVLIGEAQKIHEIAKMENMSLDYCEIIDEPSEKNAIQRSIDCILQNRADIIMKGKTQTAHLMRAVLNKEKGLQHDGLLSHIALIQSPTYHKILFVTDGGLNIAPTLEQKVQILQNAMKVTKTFGISTAKIAGLCAIETVSPKMPATIDCAILTVMSQRGQLGDCIFEGPLALDNAISQKAAHTKDIRSFVSGDVDILLVPYIECGNMLVKSTIYLSNASNAGIIVGAQCPIIVGSRADTYEARLNSIALAVSM